ncbi:hypothetical protein M9Y10_005104 [Tritrichomonas musculus]|uniref:non-specific serine/threonine protein kinase n=1 Tax=Tritrichomonas musculus TaxID=1915356 RepID=A0ABR2JKC0_9EUKA
MDDEEEEFEKNFLSFKTRIDKFQIDHLIGEGGYGQIYDVVDVSVSPNKHYAMKIEYLDSPKSGLKIESLILKKIQSSEYFPEYISSGVTDSFRYLVMGLYGPSLSTVRKQLNGERFSQYSLFHLGYHMIRCIAELHQKGYIHRDIKPSNFLVKTDRNSPVVLVDFGLSRSYLYKDSGLHKKARKDPGFIGTVRYSSIHAQNNEELSRRDDLISWFYSMIEMAKSKTPWPGNDNKKLAKQLKKSLTKEQLCEGFPPEFKEIYDLIFNLEYEDEPDYERIQDVLMNIITEAEFKVHQYEWEFFSKNMVLSISPIPLYMGEPSDILKPKIVERNISNSESLDFEEEGCAGCIIF